MISSNDCLPYSCYKVLRFIDYNDDEQIRVVKGNVDYEVNENGVITSNIHYYDAITGQWIITTNRDIEKLKLENISNYYISSIISFGELSDLRDIAITRGMSEEYAYSILSDNIKSRNLYVRDVAIMYALLTMPKDVAMRLK